VVQQTHAKQRQKLQLIYLVICLIGLYGIVPQLRDFQASFTLWHHVRVGYVLAAIASCALTYVFAAGTYYILVFARLGYGRTLLVELASMFVNRLLPAGVGGIGANYAYQRKAKIPAAEASAVVAINNVLGLIGHCCLVISALICEPSLLRTLHTPHISSTTELIALGLTVLVVLLLVTFRRRLPDVRLAMKRFIAQVRSYRQQPLRISAALVCSLGLTVTNIAALWFSVLAIGFHLSPLSILLVFTLGIGVGTVTPTPGGVGGVEAALVTGLVAYHMSAVSALAAVLVYRLISYWLALIVGAGTFVVVRHRGYF
jgi:uncharacterized membrane protein YbhN (UPF0104 family)